MFDSAVQTVFSKFMTDQLVPKLYPETSPEYIAWKAATRVRLTINQLLVEFVLATDNTEYTFSNYQRLNGTIINQLYVPVATGFTKSSKNKDIAAAVGWEQAFLFLQDVDSNDRYQNIPLLGFVRDTTYIQGKSHFPQITDIDWTKSGIIYPSTTVPNANAGKVVPIVIEFYQILALK